MVIALISLGCPKNQVDADVMCHALLERGHITTADLSEADAIIVNTCGFIESAKQEAIDSILEACSYKEQKPELKVVVTGCLAQRYQHEIVKEIPEVDAVVGLGSNAAICSILERLTGTQPVESYGAKESLPLGGKRVISTPRHYAYLKIAEGCNNRCHYCAIPLIRGPLRSRTIPDIVAEARFLAGEGVKELIVVAQDITAFGADRGRVEIAELLDALNAAGVKATFFVVATGYGRALLPEADKSITEITCHGAGAAFLCPGCDTVIDIGGQDSKVILLDPSGGQVKDFLMNDKCAAGTGRFLEMTMSRVGSDITSIDTFVEGAEPVTINSMCAVFAESEIIGLLAQETPPGSIALGCIYSICRRTAIFAQKLAPEHPKVFFSGGLAQSQVVREVLARYLGVESVTAHPLCQYNGAIGAAVLGWKQVNR